MSQPSSMQSRSNNYSYDEIEALISYLGSYPELISGDLNKNPKETAEEWDNVATFVNATSLGIVRTGDQLRSKWRMLKYRTKKKAADITHSQNKTGGGSAIKKKLTEQEQKIISLMGTTCFTGVVPEKFDSTSHLLKERNSAENCVKSPVPHYSQENVIANTSAQVVNDSQYSEDLENQSLDTTEEISRQSLSLDEIDTPQQRKRKMDCSTPRVKTMRQKKKREEEERNNQIDNTIMSNQEKIVKGLEKMNVTLENILTNQNELLEESRITNNNLNVLSQNVATLIQIGARFLNLDVSIQNE